MNDMNKLVLGVSFYSIKVQFAKRIRIEVHGIILSLQVHIEPHLSVNIILYYKRVS